MKKLTSSPSTKPDTFLYTDFSIRDSSSNPKHSLSNIFQSLNKIVQFRTYMSKADFSEIYLQNQLFLKKELDLNSMDELWEQLNKNKDDRLKQRQILSFLTKIVIGMTRNKNQCAKNKMFDKFAQYKSIIQWLEEKIVQFQKELRLKIKQIAIGKFMKQRVQRQTQFKKQSVKVRQSLHDEMEKHQKQAEEKNERDKHLLHKIVNQKAEKQIYVYKPSKRLQQTKDKSLLTKLAPYKSEKKRPYECKTLQQSLDLAISEQKNRIKADMTHFKRTQMNKLKKKQQLQHECYLTKLKAHNDEVLTRLSIKKEELNKAEDIKIAKIIKETDHISKQRIRSLQNSLKAYSQRDQSQKIRQIMQTHRENVQFVNDIDSIADIAKHGNFSPRYSTINMQAFREKKRRIGKNSQLRAEKKILRKIKNQPQDDSQEETKILKSHRRSLVDMYNEDLEVI